MKSAIALSARCDASNLIKLRSWTTVGPFHLCLLPPSAKVPCLKFLCFAIVVSDFNTFLLFIPATRLPRNYVIIICSIQVYVASSISITSNINTVYNTVCLENDEARENLQNLEKFGPFRRTMTRNYD